MLLISEMADVIQPHSSPEQEAFYFLISMQGHSYLGEACYLKLDREAMLPNFKIIGLDQIAGQKEILL
jgi:hypothetical protein